MKKLFFLIVFINFSCEQNNEIHSVLKLDNDSNKIVVELINDSPYNYYFYRDSFITFQEINYSNETNVFTRFDTIYQDTTVRRLKKVAYNNFYNSGEIFTSYDTSIIVLDPEKYDADKTELDSKFFFIKSKSKLIIRYKRKFKPNFKPIKKKYTINNVIDNKLYEQNRHAVKKFYSYGKIGDYYPYTKEIECKPIIVEF